MYKNGSSNQFKSVNRTTSNFYTNTTSQSTTASNLDNRPRQSQSPLKKTKNNFTKNPTVNTNPAKPSTSSHTQSQPSFVKSPKVSESTPNVSFKDNIKDNINVNNEKKERSNKADFGDSFFSSNQKVNTS